MLRTSSIIRGPLFAAAVVVSMVVAQGQASATDGEPFGADAPKFDILAGRDMVDVGDAWFARETVDGHEELHVHFHVPEGFSESQLCLSGEAFDERVPPGQCPYSTTEPGTEGSYDIDLGTTYLDAPLYIQLHVSGSGWTAYPGSVDPGNGPFYGNVEIGATETQSDESDTVVEDDVVEDTNSDEGDETVADDEDEGADPVDDTVVDDPELGEDDVVDDGDDVTDGEDVESGTGDVEPVGGEDDDESDIVDGTTDESEQHDGTVDDTTTIVDDTAAGSDEELEALTSSTRVDRSDIEVLGAVLNRPSRTSLPRTGADAAQLVALAVGLLLAGGALELVARRRNAMA